LCTCGEKFRTWYVEGIKASHLEYRIMKSKLLLASRLLQRGYHTCFQAIAAWIPNWSINPCLCLRPKIETCSPRLSFCNIGKTCSPHVVVMGSTCFKFPQVEMNFSSSIISSLPLSSASSDPHVWNQH
jgi:hypothetical protein